MSLLKVSQQKKRYTLIKQYKVSINMKTIILSIFCLFITLISQAQTNSSTYYINKAQKLLDKKNYEEAMQVLTDGIKVLPDSANLYLTRGALLDAFTMHNEAIKDFSKGLEKAQDDQMKVHLLGNRGASKYKVRDFDGSYKDLTTGFRIDSTDLYILNNLALVCKERKNYDEALKYLFKVVETDSLNATAYMNIGFTYQGMNEHTKAMAYFDKTLELDPKMAFAYSNRAFSKLKTNDLKGAMKDINQSIKLNSINSYAYKNRALIYIEEKKYKEACADLAKANELGYTRQYGKEVNELISKYCQ
jgi:tetratricopeptide (TPR) repeat protein